MAAQMSPGAWLSGFGPAGVGLAGLDAFANPPVQKRWASTNPPVGRPGFSAEVNPPVDQRAFNADVNPPVDNRALQPAQMLYSPGMFPGQWVMTRSGPRPGEPLVPWNGIDPSWVWDSSQPRLLAQALRKLRARVVPPADLRIGPSGTGDVVSLAGSAKSALFRWDASYRISAIVDELLGRLVAEGQQLWWVPAPSEIGSKAMPALLHTVEKLPKHFDYSDQIDKVLRAAVEREDRMPEILTQATDIGPFFDAVTGIDRATAPRLAELIQVAWEVGTHIVMALKNNLAEWRPYQRSARVVPVIATPGHGTLPSGHATLAMLTSALLSKLLYPAGDVRRTTLDRVARRIAFNRVVAGVHFPMDSAAGAALANQIARALIAAAHSESLPEATKWDVRVAPELEEIGVDPAPPPLEKGANGKADQPSDPPKATTKHWRALWRAAVAEVALRRI
ncbi:phosphatase PAP2 family protein [Methylibium rhizosphaerae]|uniref:phosphatase PAP2 family protein n=1 Tax=Methylibium rhizosphaerae TaxID=2570323 RepID=UPI0011297DCA|nr:phosphatase PAP2 family protein [Methylibium rhizosphaerae]